MLFDADTTTKADIDPFKKEPPQPDMNLVCHRLTLGKCFTLIPNAVELTPRYQSHEISKGDMPTEIEESSINLRQECLSFQSLLFFTDCTLDHLNQLVSCDQNSFGPSPWPSPFWVPGILRLLKVFVLRMECCVQFFMMRDEAKWNAFASSVCDFVSSVPYSCRFLQLLGSCTL